MSDAVTSQLPLDTLALTIKAHVVKGDASIEKAEQHYKAAGIHLMEAKERVKEMSGLTWPAWLNSQCGIRRRRADELIAIADGRTSLVEMREKNRERVAAHRERKKSESALRNAEPAERIANPIVPRVSDESSDLHAICERQARKIESLNAQVARLKEQLEIKESQRRMAVSEAAIASNQREEAQNRAMFAEADKEQLQEELARVRLWLEDASVTIHYLRGTEPPPALRKRNWFVFGDEPPEAEPAQPDNLTDADIPAFLKKDAA